MVLAVVLKRHSVKGSRCHKAVSNHCYVFPENSCFYILNLVKVITSIFSKILRKYLSNSTYLV